MIQVDQPIIRECVESRPSSKPRKSIILISIISLLTFSILSGVLHLSSLDDSHHRVKGIIRDNNSEINDDILNVKGWFSENTGQIENPDIRFVSSGSDYSIGFIESGYIAKIVGEDNLTSFVQMTFEGSNPVAPEGRGELAHRSNFFIGSNSSKWKSHAKNFQEVIYENLYHEIDIVYYTTGEGLKYDIIVYPGGDPGEIRFSYGGTDKIYTDYQGDLHIECSSGELIEKAPYCYQKDEREKSKIEVSSQYIVDGNMVGFKIGKYNPNKSLVIDPLMYSTFIGGSNDENGADITLDDENNVIVVGSSDSPNFPTTSDSYDESYNGGERDIFVLKLSPDGSELLFSTFIGGSDRDIGYGITLDEDNNVYISGYTLSDDFPTTSGCYDDTQNGGNDAIVLKLSSDGSDLIYSTYVGGMRTEHSSRIMLDPDNNAYIAGITTSPDFPTTAGSYDRTFNGGNNFGDVFVFKLDLRVDSNDGKNGDEDDDEFLLPHPSLAAAGFVGLSAFGLLGIAFFREDLRFALFSILTIPLYSKIEKDEILDHPNRHNIYNYLFENPGTNLTKVYREMGIGYGTLVHHLNTLEKEKLIISKKEMGMKLFYPIKSGSKSNKNMKELLLSPPQNKIYNYLKEKGRASRLDIEKDLDINLHTAKYCLKRLCEWGLVDRTGRGKYVKYEAVDLD